MRAENNWEDKVGKRLFDVEGEPSPQAWENVSRRILPAPKPKPNPVWKWLPLLLLFITLPIAFFNSESFKKKLKTEGTVLTEGERTESSVKQPAVISNSENTRSAANTAQEPQQLADRKVETRSPDSGENPGKNLAATSETAEKSLINSGTKAEPGSSLLVPAPVAINKNEPQEKEKATRKFKTRTDVSKGLLLAGTSKNQPVNSIQKENPENKPNLEQTVKKGLPKNVVAATTTNQLPIKQGVQENSSSQRENAPEQSKGVSKTEISELTSTPTLTSAEEKNKQEVAVTRSETQVLATADPALKADSILANNILPADTIKVAVEKKEKTGKKNLSWLVYGSPQYTFQRVFANPEDEVMIVKLLNKNEIESERMGYEFGFRGNYPVKEKLNLEMGFHFARINQHLKFRTAQTQADSVTVFNQNGQISMEIRNRVQNESILFQYFFGGIYAGANLALTNTWSVAGGLGANYLLWKNPDEEKIPIPTTNVSPYLSAGLRYNLPINQNLTLQAGPNVQYFLRPVQKESAHYGVKPTTFGFTLGLLFNGKQ